MNKKKSVISIQNGLRYNMNGWNYIMIKGSAFERGYAYGKLVSKDMKRVEEIRDFIIYNYYGVKWDFFVNASNKYLKPIIVKNFNEFYKEMVGFAKGCCDGGFHTTEDDIIAWNNWMTLTDNWWANMPKEEKIKIQGNINSHHSLEGGGNGINNGGRCSAFMAVGKDWTSDGKIICGHNTFTNFTDGSLGNYVINIIPSNGHSFIMTSCPGWIWSGSDFFITSAGIIGTETTIGGFSGYENKYPISCRIRQAMQYGNNFNDYIRILLYQNSGDYANSWLFGDTKINEIMRLELGLKYHNIQTISNGYFIGFNATYDPKIRNLECNNTGFDDIRRHQGARRVRLEQLMDKHKGKLNIKIAQQIMADHYDPYLNKINPCSRTICAHYELDPRDSMSDPSRPKPFQPRGALDGKVVDTTMCENMSISLRWGNSCGTPFNVKKFCNKNPIWSYWAPYMNDRPSQPWTIFSLNYNDKKQNKTKKRK